MYQRTSVGLDVHARSVVACGIDGETGEVFERRLTPQHGEILAWIRNLPAPVAVAYEAGPTGYGLARFLPENGIDCVVAAPSKLQRPAGDRVKTDRRDARHLARLLHLNEIVAVNVPSVTQEAARDLVRAREATRKDLMSARHRVSKLLLRQGIVYYGGRAWTGKHELWLRAQHFDVPGRQLAYDTVFDTMLATTDRRDRLDTAIAAMAADSEYTPVVTRLGCLRGVSTLTAFALAVEIGDWHRLTGRSVGAYLGLVPSESSSGGSRVAGTDHQDRQRARPPAARRSGLAPPHRVSAQCGAAAPLGSGQLRRHGPAASAGNRRLHARWQGVRRTPQTRHRRQRRDRPRTRRLVLVAGRARRLSASSLMPHPGSLRDRRSPLDRCQGRFSSLRCGDSTLTPALHGDHHGKDPGNGPTAAKMSGRSNTCGDGSA